MLTLSKTDLLGPLSIAAAAADEKIIPTLGFVLVEPGSITGTDSQIALRAALSAAGFAPFLLPAARSVQIIRSLPDGEIRIEPEADRVLIRCGRSRYQLPTRPAEDFPLVELSNPREPVVLTGFPGALKTIAHAMGNGNVRHYLNGAYLDADLGQAVATDGSRLAAHPVDGLAASMILPRETVLEIIRRCGDGPLTMTQGDRQVRIAQDGLTLTSSLVGGRYPNWQQVVPAPGAGAEFSRGELLSRVRRLALIRNGAGVSGVIMESADGQSTLRVLADGSEAEERIAYRGQLVERIGVNADYLVDAIAALEGETVTIHASGSEAAILIHGSGPSRQVIMPMRI